MRIVRRAVSPHKRPNCQNAQPSDVAVLPAPPGKSPRDPVCTGRTKALLLEVAQSNDRLLAEPAPQAFFKGFGESSLDFVLHAWTDAEYDARTSALALAIHRSLCKAGIAIPFPQRDLHLASLSPEVHAALSGLDRKA